MPFAFTALQLQRVCHYAPVARLFTMLLPLNDCLERGQVTTPLRGAMFVAQLAHESGEFRYMEELADGHLYDVRVNARLARQLGNVQPGDGSRFKGRGPIQITGRTNYAKMTAALGVDLVAHPELLAEPKYGFQAAAEFWREQRCNESADQGDVEGCTRRINAGLNGLDFRIGYYKRAVDALGLERLGVA